MPLAAAAKKPTDDELVVAVERVLDGEDVQTFNIKALMKRLGTTCLPHCKSAVNASCTRMSSQHLDFLALCHISGLSVHESYPLSTNL